MRTVLDLDQYAWLYPFGATVAFLLGCQVIWPRWRKSLVGRAMVALDATLFVALLPNALHEVFGLTLTSPFVAYYVLVAAALVGTTILWRLWVVWRVQRHE